MTPLIAARIHEIRMALLRHDLPEEEELALCTEAVKLFAEARGATMTNAQAAATKKKKTKVTGVDLLNQALGASDEQ